MDRINCWNGVISIIPGSIIDAACIDAVVGVANDKVDDVIDTGRFINQFNEITDARCIDGQSNLPNTK